MMFRLLEKFFLTVVAAAVALIVALVFIYAIAIFISVVFLGGSSACPQNLC